MPASLAEGHLDIHAHLLPEDGFRIPLDDRVATITERHGEMHLDDFPMAVTRAQLAETDHLVADMDAHGIAVRVVSAPPYAFATRASTADAAAYATTLNDAIARECARFPGRLVPFGVVPLQDAAATAAEAARISAAGIAGIAVPPIVGDIALGDPELDHLLETATRHDLPILVHPTQSMAPGYRHHYLRNLIGNPVESTVAIASLSLSNAFERFPSLRILFVHGAGCAPALLGRWDHGWAVRADVSADTTRPPSEIVGTGIYADTLTHSDATAALLRDTIDPSRIALGSDYPFDMADPDPVASARRRGFDLAVLRENAIRWLGRGAESGS